MNSYPFKPLPGTFLLLFALAFVPLPARAMTVEGVSFAQEAKIGDATVPLRNAALLLGRRGG